MSTTDEDARAVLQKDVGTWDAELTIVPQPGAAPIQQRGVATNRLIAGGRWLVVEFRADSGFEGHGLYGWDTATDRYTGVWADGAGGGMARATGTWDAARATMTYEVVVGEGASARRYREVTRTVDADTLAYQNLVPLPDGQEHAVLAITYRRRS